MNCFEKYAIYLYYRKFVILIVILKQTCHSWMHLGKSKEFRWNIETNLSKSRKMSHFPSTQCSAGNLERLFKGNFCIWLKSYFDSVFMMKVSSQFFLKWVWFLCEFLNGFLDKKYRFLFHNLMKKKSKLNKNVLTQKMFQIQSKIIKFSCTD